MMSRPTRAAAKAATKLKAESSESDSEDWDEEDPDNMTVPGGGSTLSSLKNDEKGPDKNPATTKTESKLMNLITDAKAANAKKDLLSNAVSSSGLDGVGSNRNASVANQRLSQPGTTGQNYFPPAGYAPMNQTQYGPRDAAMALSQLGMGYPGMAMYGAIGLMGGGAAAAAGMSSQALLQAMYGAGLRQGLDMSNPIIIQMMMQQMQQALGMTASNATQMQKMTGMYPGLASFVDMMKFYSAPSPQPAMQMGMSVNPLMMSGAGQQQQEDDEEEEGMGVAETFADYMPLKLMLGKKHPDPVVETASMSSVEPPDIFYELSLPDDTVDSCKLSALQLECIVYAAQQHEYFLPDESRAGYLIGDGAGVGKGRTIAGIIWENYLKGRKKSIWVSVSNDLKYDSERDLSDIGVKNIPVKFLSKMKYAKINSDVNGNVKQGVLFTTYSSLIGESSASQGKYKTRFKQIINWCGEDFDGVIVFDECHRAKNLCPVGSGKPTKTGLTVLELQNQLPKARVVYASATGASEPKNMAYMIRLGIWGKGTPFREFSDFVSAVDKRGVGAMELVAMDMKLRGMYIARQLSFHGTTFKIEEVTLHEDFQTMYDDAVALWVDARQKFQEAAELINAEKNMKKTMWGQFWSSHQRFFKYLCIGSKVDYAVRIARDAVKTNRCVVIGLQSTGEARTLEQLDKDDGELSDFVSTAKGVLEALVEKHFPAPDRGRISKILGISESSKEFKEILEDINNSGSNTATTRSSKRKPSRQAAQKGKKRYKETAVSDKDSDSDFDVSGSEKSEDDDFSSEASSEFTGGSDLDDEEEMWMSSKKNKGKAQKGSYKKNIGLARQQNGERIPAPPKEHIDMACEMKSDLLKKIEALGRKLPPNTLDQLIDELGGPENVAEMTGRKGRVVQSDDGQISYESRSEIDVSLELLNIKEKERFMAGEKDIAIISEAASSGISLQSDRRVKNQRRRVHITLELPWSADRAIQQFGRTHRSNQVNAPEYIFLISELAGERRFASIVAKRLESLGALTHGDRRATESRDLSSFNIDNKYGRLALESAMKTMMGYEHPIVPPPSDYEGDFFSDIQQALVGVGLIGKEDNIHQLDKDFNNISKFLNRILGMPVELQNRFFKYFTDTLAAIINQAKKTGKYDLGILDLGTGGEGCHKTKTKTWVSKHATGTAKTQLHTVLVERGMSWSEACDKYLELAEDAEGFYLSHQVRNHKKTAVLAVMEPSATNKKREKNNRTFVVYRPNTGMQMKQETYSDLKKKYKKVGKDEAQEHWENQYKSSSHCCSHAYWQGNCRRKNSGLDCEIGLRRRTYHVLCGSVLNVWARVEDVFSQAPHSQKMQVIRLKTHDGVKLVGTLIPNNLVQKLGVVLKEIATDFHEEEFEKEGRKPCDSDDDIQEIKVEKSKDQKSGKVKEESASKEQTGGKGTSSKSSGDKRNSLKKESISDAEMDSESSSGSKKSTKEYNVNSKIGNQGKKETISKQFKSMEVKNEKSGEVLMEEISSGSSDSSEDESEVNSSSGDEFEENKFGVKKENGEIKTESNGNIENGAGRKTAFLKGKKVSIKLMEVKKPISEK